MKLVPDHLVLVQTGGSSIGQHKPLFSLDSRFLLCPCGNSIKVFSVETGQCYQKLDGHEDDVTAICHHPKVNLQIISCSLDNTVRIWDYEDAMLLSTYIFKLPIKSIFCHQTYDNNAFVVFECPEDTHEIHRFELKAHHSGADFVDTSLVGKKLPAECERRVAFSGNFFVVAHPFELVVHRDMTKHSSGSVVKHKIGEKEVPIECVACHPTDQRCATGHQNGQIKFWHSICSGQHVVCNTQHWHSLPVLSLAYSPTGTGVFSGGHEGVLVHWRDEEDKHFLPRLGAPINHLAVANDNSLRATVHVDNSILIITSYSTVKQVIEGFTATSQTLPCGLELDSVTGSCVTNGKLGHLLFYNAVDDSQLYNLDIVSRNFISPADLGRPLSHILITNLAFTTTTDKLHLMATVEFDVFAKRDQKLKFWNFDEHTKQWCLDTVVSAPHRDCDVTSLRLHPYEALCVTTSTDRLAKVWSLSEEEQGWSCIGALEHRGFPATACDFSADGSVLAVGFGHTVSLCDTSGFDSMMLLLSDNQPITGLKFGRSACCRHLVVTTSESLQTWDVARGEMAWCVPVHHARLLRADPCSDLMAVFDQHNIVHVFQPSEEKPIFIHQLPFDVSAACFVPSSDISRSGHSKFSSDTAWWDGSQLYIVSNRMTVHKFCTEEDMKTRSARRPPMSSDNGLATPISALLRPAGDRAVTTKTSLRRSTVREAVKSVIHCPPHVMPPLQNLADQFISALILDSITDGDDDEAKGTKPSSEIGKEFESFGGKSEPISAKAQLEISATDVPFRLEDFAFLRPFYANIS